jgi:GPH family glycoside/pentoside/hexuronide:cation symporter
MEGRKRFILLMYSLGYLGISIFVQTTVKWYQYFYAPPETNQGGLKVLVPLGFVGFAMIVASPVSCFNPGDNQNQGRAD